MDPADIKKIIKDRKSIRRKLELLKRNELSNEKSFEPITKPLRSIAKRINPDDLGNYDKGVDIKRLKVGNKEGPKPDDTESIKDSDEYLSNEGNSDSDMSNQDSEDYISTSGSIIGEPRNDIDGEYLEQLSDLPRSYIPGLIHNTEDIYDLKYGVRYIPDEDQFYIGNAPIRFNGNDLIVNDKEYEGTPGLYELLFKKQSRNYTEEDKKKYLDILNSTSAHKRFYQAENQISGNKSWKYKHIIKPMIKGPQIRYRQGNTSGQDMKINKLIMHANDNTQHDDRDENGSDITISTIGINKTQSNGENSIEPVIRSIYNNGDKIVIKFKYWTDPNEVVYRLRFLLDYQDVGNTNYNEEIAHIIETLFKVKLINPDDY